MGCQPKNDTLRHIYSLWYSGCLWSAIGVNVRFVRSDLNMKGLRQIIPQSDALKAKFPRTNRNNTAQNKSRKWLSKFEFLWKVSSSMKRNKEGGVA